MEVQDGFKEFKEKGFQKIKLHRPHFDEIRNEISNFLTSRLNQNFDLEDLHQLVDYESINPIRQGLISHLSNLEDIHQKFSLMSNGVIEDLLGNSDIAVQKTINTSIQLPNDSSSLLPLHTDVFAGNSPYEVIFWIPFVNVEKSSSFYLLPLEESLKYYREGLVETKEAILEKENKSFIWPQLEKGEALIFSPALIHGNIVNTTSTTRISCNIRFKSLHTPYHVKKPLSYFKVLKKSPLTEIGEIIESIWKY